jgi:hypothetical protein
MNGSSSVCTPTELVSLRNSFLLWQMMVDNSLVLIDESYLARAAKSKPKANRCWIPHSRGTYVSPTRRSLAAASGSCGDKTR